MSQILKKLKGGDLRSIGRSNEVVQEILDKPSLFKEVFEGMLSSDPIIRMRSFQCRHWLILLKKTNNLTLK
ncbi:MULTISPECIES: hypothetical protein [Psychrilyobacter]|uniref:hypothetical protein n=1 Tax=Psychrilyobacter TaxID=623282 RepID=UPI0011C07CF4|nr:MULTISPECIES: hypothetical protein [Psychrilyobacter]MCS5422239.1 hypothetical protein [Psychrilyobacter sp. S5]NDI78753.1 hypothetical protein [Psychrilyobacter piezotolerans]